MGKGGERGTEREREEDIDILFGVLLLALLAALLALLPAAAVVVDCYLILRYVFEIQFFATIMFLLFRTLYLFIQVQTI